MNHSARGRNYSQRYGDLIRIATELMSEIGYEQTTVRMIADRMGIKSGSLYSHTSTKADVLYRIVLDVADEFLVRAQARLTGIDSPVEKLRALCRAHLEVIHDRPRAVRVYFDEWRKLGQAEQAEIIQLRDQYEGLYRAAIIEGIDAKTFDVDAPLGARVVLSTLNWAPGWYSPEGPLDPATIADQILDVTLRGFLARG